MESKQRSKKIFFLQPLETTAPSDFNPTAHIHFNSNLNSIKTLRVLSPLKKTHTQQSLSLSLAFIDLRVLLQSLSLSLSLKFIIFALSLKPWKVLSLFLNLSFAFISLIQGFDLREFVFCFVLFCFTLISDQTVEMLLENCDCFAPNLDLKPSSPSASGSPFCLIFFAFIFVFFLLNSKNKRIVLLFSEFQENIDFLIGFSSNPRGFNYSLRFVFSLISFSLFNKMLGFFFFFIFLFWVFLIEPKKKKRFIRKCRIEVFWIFLLFIMFSFFLFSFVFVFQFFVLLNIQ